MSEEFATRTELNGLGSRLNEVEMLKPRMIRTEDDIQVIFKTIECDKKEHVDLRKEIGVVGLEIQKSINNLMTKSMIGIAVPTILILVQLLMQALNK